MTEPQPKNRRRKPPAKDREPVPGEWGSEEEGWSGFQVTLACLGVVGVFAFLIWQSLSAAGVFAGLSTFIFVVGPHLWKFYQHLDR